MSNTTINIHDLQIMFNSVIGRLKKDGMNSIEVDLDYYLLIGSDDWNKLEENPKPVIGSLADDWNSLLHATEDGGTFTYVDFERLASVLRAVSETINPTDGG